MSPKTSAKLTAIQKCLQQEFGLRYFEAEILADDVLANLKVLRRDVAANMKSGNWAAMGLAGRALGALGTNLGQEELCRLGAAFTEAAEAENEAPAEAMKGLEALLSELGCDELVIPMTSDSDLEEEVVKEGDDAVFAP